MSLPWEERVPMLSIHPEAATPEDVARLAAEYMDCRAALAESQAVVAALREYVESELDSYILEDGRPGCSGCEQWAGGPHAQDCPVAYLLADTEAAAQRHNEEIRRAALEECDRRITHASEVLRAAGEHALSFAEENLGENPVWANSPGFRVGVQEVFRLVGNDLADKLLAARPSGAPE